MGPLVEYVLELCGQEFAATGGWDDLAYGISNIWMLIKEEVHPSLDHD